MEIRFAALLAALSALVVMQEAAARPYEEILVCASTNHSDNFCPIDTRGGVRLLYQLSSSDCIEGRTWGLQPDGIWVADGCRAQFAVLDSRYSVVRCESQDYRREYCEIEGRGGVQLLRQFSNAECIEGRTWGADNDRVWVSDGCRGEFAAGGAQSRPLPVSRPGYGGGSGHNDVLRCESIDRRHQRCPVRIRGDVELVRQLSEADCRFNTSWGYDRNGVWVDRGCRGEFRID